MYLYNDKKLVTRVIESRSKISVLADESTRVSNKSTLIVFLRASVDSKAAPINFPLDLVESESLCASHIADKVVDCLLKNGYTIELLQSNEQYSLDFAVMELAKVRNWKIAQR